MPLPAAILPRFATSLAICCSRSSFTARSRPTTACSVSTMLPMRSATRWSGAIHTSLATARPTMSGSNGSKSRRPRAPPMARQARLPAWRCRCPRYSARKSCKAAQRVSVSTGPTPMGRATRLPRNSPRSRPRRPMPNATKRSATCCWRWSIMRATLASTPKAPCAMPTPNSRGVCGHGRSCGWKPVGPAARRAGKPLAGGQGVGASVVGQSRSKRALSAGSSRTVSTWPSASGSSASTSPRA